MTRVSVGWSKPDSSSDEGDAKKRGNQIGGRLKDGDTKKRQRQRRTVKVRDGPMDVHLEANEGSLKWLRGETVCRRVTSSRRETDDGDYTMRIRRDG